MTPRRCVANREYGAWSIYLRVSENVMSGAFISLYISCRPYWIFDENENDPKSVCTSRGPCVPNFMKMPISNGHICKVSSKTVRGDRADDGRTYSRLQTEFFKKRGDSK